MKKLFTKKVIWTCLILCAVVVLLVLSLVRISPVHRGIRNVLGHFLPEQFPKSVYYVNNVLQEKVTLSDFLYKDVREVQTNSKRSYLINHSRGFSLGFPADATYDFSAAQEYIKVSCKEFSAVVSKEYSTYGKTVEDSKRYVAECLHKYLLDETYLKENKIIVHKNNMETVGKYPVQIVALSRTPAEGSHVADNTYVYCYIFKEDILFYRIMFKTTSYTNELMTEVYSTLESFDESKLIFGKSDTFTDFKPVLNEKWTDETKALYTKIQNTDTCMWGRFAPRAILENNYEDIVALEAKAETKFDGVLEYMYHTEDVPVEGMKTAAEDGKIIELTLQTSTVMNMNLNGKNPMFDVLDGQCDEQLRTIAGDIKGLKHPVLFRLNNEMNSDWTSYSASACLLDPEIYITVWKRIYTIFEEEGVDNAIWVFNPNDESFPPNGYNTSLAYYPGNEYVHMFGVTGYNTGTYYAEEHGESWRSFDAIYSSITERYEKDYGAFPWIITEFASSSIGGDKVQWIQDMFANLKNYPRIKMAFWFNSADYDERPGKEGIAARPYWFDETPETTEAFRNGINGN